MMSSPQTPARDAPPRPLVPRRGVRPVRHHTNNTLQRLLADIAASQLQRSEAGRALLATLQERILVSASISNALFAVTEAPAPLEQRLRMLCASLVQLHAGAGQSLRAEVVVTSAALAALDRHTPPGPAELVVRLARELVENALKHGMHARACGCVRVTVTACHDLYVLSVADDGWGPGEASTTSQGLGLVRDLVAPLSGEVSLGRQDGWTLARVAFSMRAAGRM